MKTKLMLAAMLLGMSQLALAAASVSVQVSMHQQKTVVDANGQSHAELLPLDKVVPGTVVTYVIHYENQGKEAADKVVLHDPIPAHMTYVANSAKGDNTAIAYSVDGGKHWAKSVSELTLKGQDGKTRQAAAADVTTLRWQVAGKLPAGAKGQAQFDAQLQ